MSLAFGTILCLFLAAYAIMLPITALHVVLNWKLLHYAGYTTVQQLKECGPRVEAYTKTIPWQPLYNLLVFGVLSFVYLRGLPGQTLLATGLLWAALGAVFDALTWVLLPHPWRLSWRELYLGHQPWLSLCYLCTALSPWAARLG